MENLFVRKFLFLNFFLFYMVFNFQIYKLFLIHWDLVII